MATPKLKVKRDVTTKGKQTFHKNRKVKVGDGKTTFLKVKSNFDHKNGEFKITGEVTTKQVNYFNEEETAQVFDQLRENMEALAWEMMELEQEVNKSASGTKGVGGLPGMATGT